MLSKKFDSYGARAGYTLPVFACAGAIAALRWLQDCASPLSSVAIDLVEPAETVDIPIEQVARLSSTQALAITRSDPGDNLDLTRQTPIWALVEQVSMEELAELGDRTAWVHPQIVLEGGQGIGRSSTTNQPAIYTYARRLCVENLSRLLLPTMGIRVTFILPEGRSLAVRTSNAAFGVVDGLSLLGTSGIAQPLSAPGQLEAFRADLQQKAQQHPHLVFCIGENGLDLAPQLGIHPARLVKTANWLGSLLVEASLQGVESILLFGYHGKLLKLAGGIFHTHHHVADGRQEIFTAHGAIAGLPTPDLQTLFQSPTIEAALTYLRQLDERTGSNWVRQIYGSIAQQIDHRTEAYIRTQSDQPVQIGSILFDRNRQVIIQSPTGSTLLSQGLLL
ncbi:MAG: cobalt-precorrin-5B (C(1))-methyltransferase [Leptolyngbyaceae cyanobacterium SL_7_1]|nr:cobalt-precorrin-5B (C(1))-methyltransferase [Leptolyngbyaceae cyanobacterium SL_7_1]